MVPQKPIRSAKGGTMSFTYNPNQLSPLDRVRFLLQDTCEDGSELQDEEILAVYRLRAAEEDDDLRMYQTAYECAYALFRRYSKMVTFSADGTSMQFTQRAKQWKEVLDTLAVYAPQTDAWSQIIYTDRKNNLRTDYLPDSVPVEFM